MRQLNPSYRLATGGVFTTSAIRPDAEWRGLKFLVLEAENKSPGDTIGPEASEFPCGVYLPYMT